MKCILIGTSTSEAKDKFIDGAIFNLGEVSEKRARDFYFNLLLQRAKQYVVPRHVDIYNGDIYTGDTLLTTVRFRDNSALYAQMVLEDLPSDTETNDTSTIVDCPEYNIELGYWVEQIILGIDYTPNNFYTIMEKWLLGEYVTK